MVPTPGAMTAWTLPLGLPLLDDSFPLPVDRPFTLRQALDAGVTRHRLRTLEQEAFVRRVAPRRVRRRRRSPTR